MKKVATVTICGQTFDLAMGFQTPTAERFAGNRAALAREGVDLYERPVALEADLESELSCIGNVAFVEALLLLLATTIQERDAALAAARRAEP